MLKYEVQENLHRLLDEEAGTTGPWLDKRIPARVYAGDGAWFIAFSEEDPGPYEKGTVYFLSEV